MPMLPVVPEVQSHVLAEFDCLDPLLSALRLDSGRLKCTCLAVSRKWLALGTSAGGLHLIQREGWKQRLILTHKEGSITQVSCCPHDEDFIAVATSQGLVVVWELQLERRGRPERVSVSWEHRGQTVTSLCWDTAALRVFAGDKGGKVSFLRAGSSKLGKVGSAFVIFPVQTITTVDSRVVQLGYLDGRLLVSSLSRCYLCDTEREKFWRVGNKERDGEYGACFFPLSRGVTAGQPPLLYCARPGSRVWEASFSGDVLSTHQFKQLLAIPPVPLISYRSEPHYNPAQKSSQSIAFPRLLYFGDQNLLTWTDSAIYVFTPQSGQVLLWTEVKDVVEIAVYRNELFCLHGDGHMSHLSLLSVERCVDRLLRREAWSLATTVCVMFQHAIAPSRSRKSIPIDRLDHLRSQLSVTTHLDLIGQLEEVVAKLEPLDSASSSRRSSISSHESFNVLDCGIYRVISRRGSQSDEETSSLVSQSMLEEERLKEFSFVQEEEEPEDSGISEWAGVTAELYSLDSNCPMCLFLSVSSFVKKTTEKINTLQMNSDLWPRPPDSKDGGQGHVEAVATTAPFPEDVDHDSQIQDPLVLLDPACLKETLQEWIPVLERVLDAANNCPENQNGGQEDQREAQDHHIPDKASTEENLRVWSPKPLPPDLQAHLTQLATLYLELDYFGDPVVQKERGVVEVNAFLRRFFFLLDQERVRRMCLLGYGDQPEVHISFMEAMLELTQSSKVVEVIQKGDLLKSLRCLRELQPWSAPMLLAHLHRLYEKHGELAVRSFTQFYPTILPSDITAMAKHSHFLAYLDNLVQSWAEEQRLSFLGSLLQPETLRQDWLELALTHDAPQKSDTLTTDGQPRWHSHFFSWGYGRLLSLLIRLPADLASKQKMAETCRSHGYWTGYVYLCCELQRRTEAFSTICRLDDMSLLEEPSGMVPQTMDEWKMLLQLSQQCSNSRPPSLTNGGSAADHIQTEVTPENLVLRLARAVGPDRALGALQEVGMQSDMELGPHSTLVCELLRVAEKRQRALIQTMLERCDRFLWSQHA
uniref:Hermansky-Pudlak syndrome 5 protein homolog n=1 Tax=Salmo trutta TaxID=8032 RepID=A0A673ZTJ3_SALTR